MTTNRIFVLRNFILVECCLLIMYLIGFSMSKFGFLQDVLGNCTHPCPPGLLCAQVITFCSEIYGRFISLLFGIIFVIYLLAFIIYKLINKNK